MVVGKGSFNRDAAAVATESRSGLVKVGHGVDSALFGGWGVRI